MKPTKWDLIMRFAKEATGPGAEKRDLKGYFLLACSIGREELGFRECYRLARIAEKKRIDALTSEKDGTK